MRINLVLITLLTILAMLGSSCMALRSEYDPHPNPLPTAQKDPACKSQNIAIGLKSATGATILFKTGNGADGAAPGAEERQSPYLVLNRNGAITPMVERMLRISVDNLQVPPSGLYVKLEVATRHTDPDLDRANPDRIRFWQEQRFIPYSPATRGHQSAHFLIVFRRVFYINNALCLL